MPRLIKPWLSFDLNFIFKSSSTALKECEFTFDILYFASGEFPDCLKQTNVLPISKKDEPLGKENCRPIIILPVLFNVYEKLLYTDCLIMWKIFSIQSFAPFEKCTVCNTNYLSYCSRGKSN